MTDRHAGYLVTLDSDVREDDAQGIINALWMTKGVLMVEPIVSDTSLAMAEARARSEITAKLFETLRS